MLLGYLGKKLDEERVWLPQAPGCARSPRWMCDPAALEVSILGLVHSLCVQEKLFGVRSLNQLRGSQLEE